ncbi:SDR family NAD(P)-dependent oxidoreductase [Siccirubricoccus phaeus]|uniref:SDR family NAD(P)-dependent oxidoreductase n=1 Tax=Siccirubricoccus phaeus TaxID=2595053 RepID=UPI0011F1BA24|nr:SDR family oxidoreductase [Siccirubricoccus phaeus]
MIDGTVVITGAARGLGRATAEALLGKYRRLILADREIALGETTARELGEGVRFLPLDIADPAAIDAFFAKVAAEAPPIIGLVNNAGVTTPTPLATTDAAAWDGVLDINLRGTFLCSRAYALLAAAKGWEGAIVNLASTAAFSARIGAAAYSASKAAIVMLTQSLAQELGPQGIRVNAVAPAMIPLPHKPTRPKYDEAFRAMVPLNRRGRPEHIATVVRFLLSADADFVSGATIPVDGGFLAGRTLPTSTE